MEFGRNSSLNFYKKDDLLYPCDSIDQVYSFSCGRSQPNLLMSRFNLSFKAISDICLSSSNFEFQRGCFSSLGFISAQNRRTSELIIYDCSQIDDLDFKSICLNSASGELIFQNIPNWQTEAPKICNFQSGEKRDQCFRILEDIKRDYKRS